MLFHLLTPENIIIWIAVGGAAGWLAEAVIKRRRFGGGADIIIGIAGAVVGALVLTDRGLPIEMWDTQTEQAVLALIGATFALAAVTVFEQLM